MGIKLAKTIKEANILYRDCIKSGLTATAKQAEILIKKLKDKKRWSTKGGKKLLKKRGRKYYSRIAKMRWEKQKKV